MKHTVSYNAKSFILDGAPVVLTSACIHFFRVPRELWADRILKARLGGMNTIETYVAWNFHEREEGRFDFSGDRDLDAFLSECERQGMYIIVRPGPYICAEWDFGGFPSYLTKLARYSDPRPRLRSDDKDYLRYVDRYLDHVVPIIAKHQWTRGGGVILVQVENEFGMVAAARGESGERYMQYLRDGFRARGIEVPLITCVGHCDGCIECINGHYPARQIPDMRRRQPNMPLFSTEFWTGWYDIWGGPHNTRPAEDLAAASMDFWAEGGCGYNYYVYHGGTNFGYTPMYLQTTSYDYDAQVSETGALTHKYFSSKRVALWARAFADVLTSAVEGDETKLYCDPRLSVRLRVSEHGDIAFLENKGGEPVTTQVRYGGLELESITVRPGEIRPVVFNVRLTPNVRLLGTSAEIAAVSKTKDAACLVCTGGVGESVEFLLLVGDSPHTVEIEVPKDEAAVQEQIGDLKLIVTSQTRADRTWVLPGKNGNTLVLGPEFVRSWKAQSGGLSLEAEFQPGSCLVEVFAPDFAASQTVEVSDERPEMPELSGWLVAHEPPEYAPEYDDSSWRFIEQPVSMVALGNDSEAYGWYRARFTSARAGSANLHFANATDRLTVWVNGQRVGSSQPPPENRQGAWTADFRIWVKAGENVIAVLADNLGLIKGDWQIGGPQEWERKGIYGDVLVDGRPILGWRFMGRLFGERHGWYAPDDKSAQWKPATEQGPAVPTWYRVEFELPMWPWPLGWPITLEPVGLSKGVLWLNGRNLGRYWTIGPQKAWYLPEPWLKRKNVLVVMDEEGMLPLRVKLRLDKKAALLRRELNLG